MATFDAALYYELANNSSDITTIVSTRIYPVAEVPQKTATEYLTFQRLSASRWPHQGGAAGLVIARYQFNCYGEKQVEASTLAGAVVAKFASFRDAAMGDPDDSVALRKSYVLDNTDQSAPPTAGEQRGPAWQMVDVMFCYVE